jgi:HAD superfamily hydrolase (TIGR01509 family)
MINFSAEQIKLVCFDFDGTIADTEPLHHRAQTQLAHAMGYTDPINHGDFVGKSSRLFWTPILASLGRDEEEYLSLDDQKTELILQMAREDKLPPSDGLLELLAVLDARGIPAAVCTSSTREYADRMLALLGLTDKFAFVIGGDEVTHRKPEPDLYLAALSHFGTEGGASLAVEDSAAGVTSANAAGMGTIGYNNPTSGNQDLSHAKWQINSIHDIMIR